MKEETYKIFKLAGLSLNELSVANLDFPPDIREQLQRLKMDNLGKDADIDRLIKLQNAGISATEYEKMQALKTLAKSNSSTASDILKTGLASSESPNSSYNKFCPNCGTPSGNP